MLAAHVGHLTAPVDRYLEENKVVVREKRKEVKKLKEQIKELQLKLNRYVGVSW